MFVGDSLSLNEWQSRCCLVHASVPNSKTKYIISAITGGITDLSFDTVGYAWQISNYVLTASYSLTLRRVMDKAKLLTFNARKEVINGRRLNLFPSYGLIKS